MPKSQRGVTFVGWLILLVPISLMLYAVIRLTPIYLNYYRVLQAVKQTASETQNDAQLNPAAVRNTLERRFDVGYVDHPTAKEIDIHRDGDHWVAVIDYEDVAPMIANVSMLVQFNKQVELQ